KRAVAEHTGDATIDVSQAPGEPTRLAHAAVDAGNDLVACGGDGVVSEIAGGAADRGGRPAIIPPRPGNDSAPRPRHDARPASRVIGCARSTHWRRATTASSTSEESMTTGTPA